MGCSLAGLGWMQVLFWRGASSWGGGRRVGGFELVMVLVMVVTEKIWGMDI